MILINKSTAKGSARKWKSLVSPSSLVSYIVATLFRGRLISRYCPQHIRFYAFDSSSLAILLRFYPLILCLYCLPIFPNPTVLSCIFVVGYEWKWIHGCAWLLLLLLEYFTFVLLCRLKINCKVRCFDLAWKPRVCSRSVESRFS